MERERPETTAADLDASHVGAFTAAKILIGMRFSLTEIESLCYDLNIDSDQIEGETKERKTEELIRYCERRGRFADLIYLCKQKRPKDPWTAVLELRNKYETPNH